MHNMQFEPLENRRIFNEANISNVARQYVDFFFFLSHVSFGCKRNDEKKQQFQVGGRKPAIRNLCAENDILIKKKLRRTF
jgi:hypothetical protein